MRRNVKKDKWTKAGKVKESGKTGGRERKREGKRKELWTFSNRERGTHKCGLLNIQVRETELSPSPYFFTGVLVPNL